MQLKRFMRWLAALAMLSMLAAACTTGDDDDVSSDDDDSGETDGGDDGDGGEGGEPEPGPGFDGETIRVGVLTPTTGPVAIIGNPLTNGNKVYFDKINAEGGIAGKYQIEMVVEDTGYVPDTAVQKYRDTHEDVVLYAQILGTQINLSVLEQLKADGLIGAPASLDSLWVNEPNLLPVGAPYQYQFINGFDWYFAEDGKGASIDEETVCSIAQDDGYGEAGVEGLEFAAEHVGFEVAESQKFPAAAEDVSAQVNALKNANCTVVALGSTPTDTGKILGTAAQLQFAPQWIGLSPTWISLLAQNADLAPYLEANLLVVSDAPDWGDPDVPGMVEMLEDLEASDVEQPPDGYFVFGYYQAKAVVALLEKAAELGDLSPEGVSSALEQLGTVDFGGLTGDYTYGETRTPPINSNIHAVVPDAPNGLQAQAPWTADFAEEFEL